MDRRLTLLCVGLCLTLAFAKDNGDENDEGTTQETSTETVTLGPFEIVQFEQVDSSDDFIEVGLAVATGWTVDKWVVRSWIKGENQTVTTATVEELSEDQTFIIQNCKKTTEYEVCAEAWHNETYSEERCSYDEEGNDFSTPVAIYKKTLIILFGVLGYILLMILIGWCVWKRDYKAAEARLLENEEGEEEEKEKLKEQQQPQTYLGAPAEGAPISSIEDADIPYITPPVHQLSPSDKANYNKAVI